MSDVLIELDGNEVLSSLIPEIHEMVLAEIKKSSDPAGWQLKPSLAIDPPVKALMPHPCSVHPTYSRPCPECLVEFKEGMKVYRESLESEPKQNKVVDLLNRAFAADPQAMDNLFYLRVSCNQALAEDLRVQVRQEDVTRKEWKVGVLGILNGVMGELNLPLVSAIFSDPPNQDGSRKLLGFQEYKL